MVTYNTNVGEFNFGLETSKRFIQVLKPNQKDKAMQIDGRTQLYFDAFCDGTEEGDVLLDKVFNKQPEAYVFRHKDCPLVFTTDGKFLYAMDMDEKDVDPIEKYGIGQIEACYNDYNEFVETIEYIQMNLNRIIPLSRWGNPGRFVYVAERYTRPIPNVGISRT